MRTKAGKYVSSNANDQGSVDSLLEEMTTGTAAIARHASGQRAKLCGPAYAYFSEAPPTAEGTESRGIR